MRSLAATRPSLPWPLATVESANDFVALACHQLCETVEQQHGQPLPDQVRGPLQLGPVTIDSGLGHATPRYALPWDQSADEPVERIIVRIPHKLNQRLRCLEGWLEQVRVDDRPAITVIGKRSDLVCLAIHQLLTHPPSAAAGSPPPPGLGDAGTRAARSLVQLNAEVPPDLPRRLRGLRDWLRVTEPSSLDPHEPSLAGLRSMNELVALACEQFCSEIEHRYNSGHPFVPRTSRRVG